VRVDRDIYMLFYSLSLVYVKDLNHNSAVFYHLNSPDME
jgi:hypothetical protein